MKIFFLLTSQYANKSVHVRIERDLSAAVCSVKTLLSLRWLWRRLAEMSVVYHSPKLPVNYEEGSSAMQRKQRLLPTRLIENRSRRKSQTINVVLLSNYFLSNQEPVLSLQGFGKPIECGTKTILLILMNEKRYIARNIALSYINLTSYAI